MQLLRKLNTRNQYLRMLLQPARSLSRQMRKRRHSSKMQSLNVCIQMLAEDPVLNVVEFDGSFVIGRESTILEKLMVDGSYEVPISRLIPYLVDPQRDAIDIGANVGFYSVLFAKLLPQRRVLAFEPVTEASDRLTNNLARNSVEQQVILCRMIASSESGTTEIKVVVGKEEYSTIGKLEHPVAASFEYQTRNLPCTTLDLQIQLHGLDPGFIKIDAEGSEHLVLGGATETLRTYRPLILAELSDRMLRSNGSSADDILRLISELEYAAIDPFQPTTPFCEKDYGDALFVPIERQGEIIDQIVSLSS